MDFSSNTLDTTGSADLIVRHPKTNLPLESDGKRVTIRLCSADSTQYQQAMHKAQRTTARSATQTGGEADPEVIDIQSAEVLAACFLGWQNVEFDGEPLDPTRENFKMLIERHRWLREQVSTFIQARANFIVGDAGK